jgi:RHS repeat-associated protein
VALTDPNQNITTEYDYEPFGKSIRTGLSTLNSYTFTAREDDSTGLYYYRARYYHPALGRFVSEDPIEYESNEINLFAYVGNNPAGFIDPFGLESLRACIEKCYELFNKRWDQIEAWVQSELRRMSYCSFERGKGMFDFTVHIGHLYFEDTNPYNPPSAFHPFADRPPNFMEWRRRYEGRLFNGPYGCPAVAHTKISEIASKYRGVARLNRSRCIEDCRQKKGCE